MVVVYIFPSYWGKIWIRLKNWSQKVERSLTRNAKVERVWSSLWERDWQGRRWAEWPSSGQGCRPWFQKPGWQPRHPKEQKCSPLEHVFPKAALRNLSSLVASPMAEHRGGTFTEGGTLTLNSMRAFEFPKKSKYGLNGLGDPESQVECLKQQKGVWLHSYLFLRRYRRKFSQISVLLISWTVTFGMQNCCAASSHWLLGSSIWVTPRKCAELPDIDAKDLPHIRFHLILLCSFYCHPDFNTIHLCKSPEIFFKRSRAVKKSEQMNNEPFIWEEENNRHLLLFFFLLRYKLYY